MASQRWFDLGQGRPNGRRDELDLFIGQAIEHGKRNFARVVGLCIGAQPTRVASVGKGWMPVSRDVIDLNPDPIGAKLLKDSPPFRRWNAQWIEVPHRVNVRTLSGKFDPFNSFKELTVERVNFLSPCLEFSKPTQLARAKSSEHVGQPVVKAWLVDFLMPWTFVRHYL